MPWDWGQPNSFADTGNQLRNAFEKNPHLKLLVCAGYYDLSTPYFEAEYALNHLGLHPEMRKNISWAFFEAGHMMYINRPTHAKLKHDVSEFVKSALPQE